MVILHQAQTCFSPIASFSVLFLIAVPLTVTLTATVSVPTSMHYQLSRRLTACGQLQRIRAEKRQRQYDRLATPHTGKLWTPSILKILQHFAFWTVKLFYCPLLFWDSTFTFEQALRDRSQKIFLLKSRFFPAGVEHPSALTYRGIDRCTELHHALVTEMGKICKKKSCTGSAGKERVSEAHHPQECTQPHFALEQCKPMWFFKLL